MLELAECLRHIFNRIGRAYFLCLAKVCDNVSPGRVWHVAERGMYVGSRGAYVCVAGIYGSLDIRSPPSALGSGGSMTVGCLRTETAIGTSQLYQVSFQVEPSVLGQI